MDFCQFKGFHFRLRLTREAKQMKTMTHWILRSFLLLLVCPYLYAILFSGSNTWR